MNKKRIKQLKQKLNKAKDFAPVWEFYMDHFMDHKAFTDMGYTQPDRILEEAIPKICQKIFGRKIMVKDILTIYVPNFQMFHGPFDAEGRIGGFIYFEDMKQGLLAVSAENPPTAMVYYSRFSEPLAIPKNNPYELN